MAHLDIIQLQYNKALRYFLLTKYSHAASSCVKALDQLPTVADTQDESLVVLHYQLWLLYINIASTILSTLTQPTSRLAKQFGLPLTCIDSMDHFCLAIWERLVKECGGAGDCDPRLVCAYLSLTLKQSIPTMGRQVAEQWFATLPDSIIDHLTLQGQTDDDTYYTSYIQLVDLYTARILPECGDLISARSFVEYNSFLTDEKKEALMNMIQHVEDNQHRQAERKKQLEQQQKEEAEAAARQAALEKERQEQDARELQERKKKEAILQQQQRQKQQQQQSEPVVPASTTTSSPRSQPTVSSTPLPSDRSLTVVKTWMQQLQATGSAASVGVLVVFFAILGLLKGPRGYLTTALRTMMEKLWQTAKMGTKVTYM
ncbi:hypothetical protein BC941DRAFT_436618 [Chlamydoabsidia padenii]|nr:hypothetical protein BC941DRAFT_436618 [Chlamydoabsidia padenii]